MFMPEMKFFLYLASFLLVIFSVNKKANAESIEETRATYCGCFSLFDKCSTVILREKNLGQSTGFVDAQALRQNTLCAQRAIKAMTILEKNLKASGNFFNAVKAECEKKYAYSETGCITYMYSIKDELP